MGEKGKFLLTVWFATGKLLISKNFYIHNSQIIHQYK